jgi:hypothetical protein
MSKFFGYFVSSMFYVTLGFLVCAAIFFGACVSYVLAPAGVGFR